VKKVCILILMMLFCFNLSAIYENNAKDRQTMKKVSKYRFDTYLKLVEVSRKIKTISLIASIVMTDKDTSVKTKNDIIEVYGKSLSKLQKIKHQFTTITKEDIDKKGFILVSKKYVEQTTRVSAMTGAISGAREMLVVLEANKCPKDVITHVKSFKDELIKRINTLQIKK